MGCLNKHTRSYYSDTRALGMNNIWMPEQVHKEFHEDVIARGCLKRYTKEF
jgi:hypothetical protein